MINEIWVKYEKEEIKKQDINLDEYNKDNKIDENDEIINQKEY